MEQSIRQITIAFLFSLVTAVYLLLGCASAPLVMAGSSTEFTEEDFSLIAEGKREESEIIAQGYEYNDPALKSYLTGVLQKILPPDLPSSFTFRVYVLSDPSCNAYSLANGAIFVNTGLLSRIENEAQAATILGHEVSHVLYRHMSKRRRDLEKSQDYACCAAVPAYFVGGAFAAQKVAESSVKSSAAGYSRESENQADQGGFQLVKQAGYDVAETPKVFMHLSADLEDTGMKEPSMYADHPRLERRIKNFNLLTKQSPAAGGFINAQQYQTAVAKAAYDNIYYDLLFSRFVVARKGAQRYVAAHPSDARGYFTLAEVTHQSPYSYADLEPMSALYLKALTLDKKYAAAWREYGLAEFKMKHFDAAKKAFTEYLSLSPAADDKEYFVGYLHECK